MARKLVSCTSCSTLLYITATEEESWNPKQISKMKQLLVAGQSDGSPGRDGDEGNDNGGRHHVLVHPDEDPRNIAREINGQSSVKEPG